MYNIQDLKPYGYELFTITVANDETQDFETKTLFRLKYLCKTRYIEDEKRIPDDVLDCVNQMWKEHGYPLQVK